MDKGMKSEEIVRALRYCGGDNPCGTCSVQLSENEYCCVDMLFKRAAESLEQTSGLVEQLRKELEWKDMVIALAQRKQTEAEAERDALLEIAKQGKGCKTCKNNEVCVQPGIDVAHWCDRCVEKCPCYGCEGGHWEWRGLPGAPAKGDHHEPET